MASVELVTKGHVEGTTCSSRAKHYRKGLPCPPSLFPPTPFLLSNMPSSPIAHHPSKTLASVVTPTGPRLQPPSHTGDTCTVEYTCACPGTSRGKPPLPEGRPWAKGCLLPPHTMACPFWTSCSTPTRLNFYPRSSHCTDPFRAIQAQLW